MISSIMCSFTDASYVGASNMGASYTNALYMGAAYANASYRDASYTDALQMDASYTDVLQMLYTDVSYTWALCTWMCNHIWIHHKWTHCKTTTGIIINHQHLSLHQQFFLLSIFNFQFTWLHNNKSLCLPHWEISGILM